MTGRRHRSARAGLVVVGVVLGAPGAAAAAPHRPSGTTRPATKTVVRDHADTGPTDVRTASLVQDGDQLVWRVQTAGSWPRAHLRAGSGRGLCLERDSATSSHRPVQRICVSWRRGHLTARSARVDRSGRSGPWRTVGAQVSHPRGNRLAVRLRPADLGARAGVLRWTTTSSWGRDPACTAQVPCADRAPDAGTATYEVRRAVVVGCTPSGPSTRSIGPTHRREIALTFDDGPFTLTSRFLDELRRESVHATFFMIGRQVAAKASLLRRMVREGHALGNHTWDHANVSRGNAGELSSTSRAIRRASGVSPCLMRPPGGATSSALADQARAMGMLDILWTVDTNDWRLPGTAAIVHRVLAGARPGAIVLMHDGGGPRGGTLAALPQIIHGLRARGYRLVTVPDLLGLHQRYRYVRAGKG